MEEEVTIALLEWLLKCYNENYFQNYHGECERVMSGFGIPVKWGLATDIAFYSFLKTCYVIEFYKVKQFIEAFIPDLFNLIKIENSLDLEEGSKGTDE